MADLSWLGGALGGVSSLASGITSAIMGNKQIAAQKQIAQQNYQNQKEFAQNSIQWRVADAKAAGIHPLYALGTNGTTYTPQSFDTSGYETISQGASNIAKSPAIAFQQYQAGQNQKLQNELLAAQIDNQKLQNMELMQSMQGQHSNQTESVVAPSVANVPAGKTKFPYGVEAARPEVDLIKIPSDDEYGLVGLAPTKDMSDWYSESFLNQLQYRSKYYLPWNNPFTEEMVAAYSTDLARAGVDLSKVDIVQEFSLSNGWTMRAVPKGKPANLKERLFGIGYREYR